MNISSSFRRLLLGAGLALAALAPAALSGAAQAAAPPTLGPIQIKAAGTSAAVSVTSAEPVSVRVDAKATAPVTALPRSQTSEIYTTAHALTLTGLASNTTYAVTVTARALDGRTATARESFTTLPKRVRIVLESIDIKDDGDLIGEGEPEWTVALGWDGGETYGCYPHPAPACDGGPSHGEGRFTPLNSENKALMWVFAEENFDRFPDTISLRASALEDDLLPVRLTFLPYLLECVGGGGCPIGGHAPTVWRVPQGVETATQILTVSGDDESGPTGTGFESTLNFSVVLYHDRAPQPAGRNVPSTTWK